MKHSFIQKTFWGWVLLGVITAGVLISLVLVSFAGSPKIMDDWKTYQSDKGKFSLQYPADWKVTTGPDSVVLFDASGNSIIDKDSSITTIIFEGKEGAVQVDYGQGFGGMCEQGYEKITIGAEQFQTCHSVLDDQERWDIAGKEFGADFTIGMFITANAPHNSNRDIILKILSTFTFTNSNVCEPNKVPEIQGLDYHDARPKILASGWQPLKTHPSDYEDFSDLYMGNSKAFWQKGYYELKDCSGSGMGYCLFLFQDSCGNYLHVTTTGVEEGNYHAEVKIVGINKEY